MKQNIPVVFLDAPSDIDSISNYGDVVVCEGNHSIRMIVNNLVAQGIKKIGFIGDTTYCKTINDRYQGYINGLMNAGYEIDPTIIANYHPANKFYKTDEVEKAIDGFSMIPEAIVCANDDIALDVIRCLKAKGIAVPQDVAVTGYDNVEGMAQVEPILTTVRVGNQRLGRRLVQQLMWRIQNPTFPKEIIYINVEVIFRQSSDRSGMN
jgi:LacI family transcriptional regulator